MVSRRRKSSRRSDSETDTESESPSPSPSDSDASEESSQRRRHRRRKERSGSRREKHRRRERSGGGSSSSSRKKERGRVDREKERRRSRKDEKRGGRRSARDGSSGGSDSETERVRVDPESVLRNMLLEFPSVASDLKQLLQMIDSGQAVDINGISERLLVRHLKQLFHSLDLEEKDGVFLLPPSSCPVLQAVGPLIEAHMEHKEENLQQSEVVRNSQLEPNHRESISGDVSEEGSSARRRVIGPEMPSAELLAAAAKLTEAQAELRDAELEEDTELFIGPAPPAVVAEAESANEAERFEEVTRIVGAEVDNPYDVVGVNHNMSTDKVKKRYWRLSLLVHPDKCSHPQANEAFIKLNKAFKDLQDPDKRDEITMNYVSVQRSSGLMLFLGIGLTFDLFCVPPPRKALDDKIKLKEEQEAFKIELKAMREAAQWRRLQGISMEGDDELLADIQVKEMRKRDEWMTTLPPERKAGVSMQSTKFSNSSKEGRGDTSVWTDTPSDRAQKAKMNYLEAYNEASALASNEEENKRVKADANLVDMYNKAKRSKSLVQKHREESTSRSKKKQKQQPQEKEDWLGKHPWKPWDREKDLEAGRQSVKLDSENMAQGLTSRFSSGNFQRNFL
ncbi:hypothetical protein EUGRSUZ_F04124 [Eucalyptus grandis]|uniref:Uncharacterized protein n=2 Tax=Eucalyptus grandis TaxID=71139 RepID=A0ACC3KR20_EUCGR|nr:hypothetical protein EUGRSUZ_F04124 [Eucalyptus grandis]